MGGGLRLDDLRKPLRHERDEPLVERSVHRGKPGWSWEELLAEGHAFPWRCPEWSGGGIVGRPRSVLAPNEVIPHTVVICSCGVIKFIPLG